MGIGLNLIKKIKKKKSVKTFHLTLQIYEHEDTNIDEKTSQNCHETNKMGKPKIGRQLKTKHEEY